SGRLASMTSRTRAASRISTSREPRPVSSSPVQAFINSLPSKPDAPIMVTFIFKRCEGNSPLRIGILPVAAREDQAGLEHLLPQKVQQVRAVAIVLHRVSDLLNLRGRDVAGSISNLFRAGHHESLALFNSLDVERRVHERFVRAGVEPGHT